MTDFNSMGGMACKPALEQGVASVLASGVGIAIGSWMCYKGEEVSDRVIGAAAIAISTLGIVLASNYSIQHFADDDVACSFVERFSKYGYV